MYIAQLQINKGMRYYFNINFKMKNIQDTNLNSINQYIDVIKRSTKISIRNND